MYDGRSATAADFYTAKRECFDGLRIWCACTFLFRAAAEGAGVRVESDGSANHSVGTSCKKCCQAVEPGSRTAPAVRLSGGRNCVRGGEKRPLHHAQSILCIMLKVGRHPLHHAQGMPLHMVQQGFLNHPNGNGISKVRD